MSTTTETTPPQKYLSTRFKLLYSTGDMTIGVPLVILMFFQLFFLIDVAGLRPDYAAWAIAAGRIWDAVNDPLFGLISDRIRSRFGRRRVLLLYGGPVLGLSFILMWLVPPFSQIGLLVYYALTFIVFDTAFTAVHVGHNSLMPELTPDYDERSSLNGYRMAFNIFATLAAIILATVLGWSIDNQRTLFTIVGVSLGLFVIIPPFIVFRITRDRTFEEPEESLPTLAAIKATLSNRPFWMVMGIYLLSWTTASILSAILVFYANYYLRVPDQANYYVLIAQFSTILFIPLSVWLSRKLDKRRAFIMGTATWIVILLGISALQPSMSVFAYVLVALAGFGIATTYVVPWAMLPDIIEVDELATGQRREGSFYAFASFFQKLGTGAALWAMGLILNATGYITPEMNVAALPIQPPEALNAIRIFAGPVPAVLLVLSIVITLAYPITRESHQATLSQLAERDV